MSISTAADQHWRAAGARAACVESAFKLNKHCCLEDQLLELQGAGAAQGHAGGAQQRASR